MVKSLLLSRKILALLLLFLVGLVRLPLEQQLSDELRAQHLVEAPVGLDMMESLGQMGMAASLGGLRSLVASVTYLVAYNAFEDVNWNEVNFYMLITTRLEPHNRLYWEEASWHMAYNAASFYQRDQTLRPAIREKLFRDHVQKGVDILQEGLRFLPGNPALLLRLAQIYQDRMGDHRKAAEAYLGSYQNGGQDFCERFAAYELVKLADRPSWEQAYEILKRYYDMGMKKQGTTIMKDLPILEDRLNIPQDKRAKAMPEDDLPRYKIKPLKPQANGQKK